MVLRVEEGQTGFVDTFNNFLTVESVQMLL